MHYDVFISYSRRDTAIADKICEILSANGFSFFIDRTGVSAGVSFTEVISKAIDESEIFLFLASENAYRSKFTIAEVFYAFRKKAKGAIIPYLLDNSRMPSELEFLLSTTNWLEISKAPIESVFVSEIGKALHRPLLNTATSTGRRINKWIWPVILIVAVLGISIFVAWLFKNERIPTITLGSTDSTEIIYKKQLEASDSLLQRALYLATLPGTIEITTEQIAALKNARDLACNADSIRKSNPRISLIDSELDASYLSSTAQTQLDSIRQAWINYAHEAFELYDLTHLESEAQNAQICASVVRQIEPDSVLDYICSNLVK